jgi:hypothetical protein
MLIALCLIVIGTPQALGKPVYVATVPMCIGAENVVNLFHENGIKGGPYEFDLGLAAVSVSDPKDKARAIRLLIADSQLHPYDYTEIEGYDHKFPRAPRTKYLTEAFNVPITDSLKCPAIRRDSNLRGAIRMTLESWKSMWRTVPAMQLAKANLTRIEYFPIEYLTSKGQYDVGYGVSTYYSLPGIEGSTGGVVWDEGKSRLSFGGSSTSPTPTH